MSALRALRPRAVRPNLSLRYQCLRRRESTAPTTPAPPAPSPAPSAPGFLTRWRTTILWSAIGLSLGLMSGSLVLYTVAPPSMPEPGSREDNILISDLNKRIDEEFKVKVLRGKCLGVVKQLKGSEGGWVEIVQPPDSQQDKILDGQLVENLQGARGLGVERLFWDRGEKRLVAVVWFGGSMSGWPGVTHGGLLATVLTEKIALANSLAYPSSAAAEQAATAAAVPQRLPGTGDHAKMLAPSSALPPPPPQPAQLSLTYKKPTYANNFYVIRVSPAYESPTEDGPQSVALPLYGHEWEATIETPDATMCVKANAKFAPSTQFARAGKEVRDAATRSYGEFKAWLWPSRQESSQVG